MEFVYGAPPGMEDEVDGLPCTREEAYLGGTAIFSVWEPTEAERRAIAAGANLRLGIYGREPISPVSLGLTTLAAPKVSWWRRLLERWLYPRRWVAGA